MHEKMMQEEEGCMPQDQDHGAHACRAWSGARAAESSGMAPCGEECGRRRAARSTVGEERTWECDEAASGGS